MAEERASSTANNVRGIEHVGMTVPDIAEAERFFARVFGVTVLFRVVSADGEDLSGKQVGAVNGLSEDNAMYAVSMLRLGNGPNLELFQMARATSERSPVISDFGVNHFSIYVEDLEEAARLAEETGATLLKGPSPAFAQEEGEGNAVWFIKTAWGSLIELISLPSPMQYDAVATQKRLLPLPR